MVAKLWYLKKVDLFSHLEEEEMEKLGDMTRMEEVSSNQPIYFPGDASDTVYILKKGRVRISRSTPDGRRITLALLEAGEIFGELALAGEEERNTKAEAVEDSFICAASKDTFLDFISEHPDISLRITQIIGDRRREIESKIEQLIFRNASGRLSFVLLDLFENHREESNGEAEPQIKFSHQEIADLAGLTRPTTTNLLNEFQERGLIELGRKKIILKDYAGLKRAAEATAA